MKPVDFRKAKDALLQKLINEKVFWSFDMTGQMSVPDETLIEETLIHLDIDDINRLFQLFGRQRVKSVWLKTMVIQGDYYSDLNRLYSWFYFDIKNPDRYLKAMVTRHYNKLAAL